MGLPTKRPSVADDYSSYGKQSGVTNLYLLPECDEEDYDPKAELPSNEIETIKETVQPGHKQTAGPFSFKKVARAITKQRKWSTLLKDVRQSDDHTLARGFVAKSEDGKGTLSFNLNAFKRHVQSCGFIPSFVKKTLKIPSWSRTDEEIEVILQVVKKLKYFDRYPMYLKRELAKVLFYDKFERGRVVIKQGHDANSFYFILSGSVIVERMEEDKSTGEQHKQLMGEMEEGDAFGELALLQNTRRTATIICKQDSEFLRVDKPDFDEVLRNSHQIEWERKVSMLSSQPTLQDWTEPEIGAIVQHTKVREFPPNSMIVGDIHSPPDNLYLIHSGNCRVVREITMFQRESLYGSKKLMLPPIDYNKRDVNRNNEKVIKKYLTIHILKKGDAFGVGEDLKKTFVVSIGRVHCLVVSRLVFLKRDRGKALEIVKQNLSEAFMTQREAFKFYIEDRNWKIYKKKLVDEIVKRRKRLHCTTFHDVPAVVRADNEHYFEDEKNDLLLRHKYTPKT
ncbi:cyclic nucleotide-binding domain-containing protein 2-like [Acropora muricata]|uniref:cyclic nucleotide-binding domain-containing protein 2-like n=1 Tax=Acropora muricata TaxID=159855 RepID=UPI0034E5E5DC